MICWSPTMPPANVGNNVVGSKYLNVAPESFDTAR